VGSATALTCCRYGRHDVQHPSRAQRAVALVEGRQVVEHVLENVDGEELVHARRRQRRRPADVGEDVDFGRRPPVYGDVAAVLLVVAGPKVDDPRPPTRDAHPIPDCMDAEHADEQLPHAHQHLWPEHLRSRLIERPVNGLGALRSSVQT
jgi:hypothetical protein